MTQAQFPDQNTSISTSTPASIVHKYQKENGQGCLFLESVPYAGSRTVDFVSVTQNSKFRT